MFLFYNHLLTKLPHNKNAVHFCLFYGKLPKHIQSILRRRPGSHVCPSPSLLSSLPRRCWCLFGDVCVVSVEESVKDHHLSLRNNGDKFLGGGGGRRRPVKLSHRWHTSPLSFPAALAIFSPTAAAWQFYSVSTRRVPARWVEEVVLEAAL